jgi:hypothetical protein
MKIPAEALLPVEKLTRYLLVPRPEDDKSQFLRRAGFRLEDWPELERAIRELANEQPATEDGANEFGVFYRQDGLLRGPNGKSLSVSLIWLQWYEDGSFHFVTLKPRRTKR